MSDLSPILSLPLLQASQAQKHVTHNEALMRLDLLVQMTVADRNRAAAPASPVEGQRHIIAASPAGSWAGQAGKVAVYQDAAWQFVTPSAGWRAWVTSEAVEVAYNGSAWTTGAGASIPSVLAVDEIGISTSSDNTNRLAVSSAASLFNHAGAGHQIKVNKSATGQTASLLFQTGFSGRAEMGTMGDNNFAIKVSPDGTSYTTALKVDAASAAVELAKPVVLVGQATAPSGPANGTLWHDSTRGQLMAQIDGQTRIIDQQADLPCLVPPSLEWVMTSMGSGSAATVQAGAAGRIDLFPFVPCADLVVGAVGMNCTTAVASSLCKVVIYDASANGQPNALLLETGTMDMSTIGNKTASVSITLRRGRTYWIGARYSSTASVSSWALQATPDINGGTTMVTTARKTLRRTVTFTTAAPAIWGYVSSEINAGVAPAIWLRIA